MLEVKKLSKFYGSFCALKDVSFFLKKGQKAALLGLNGAGKTTLFRLITGYLVASDGFCEISGIDIFSSTLKARKYISYLPEYPPLYEDLKVLDYLKFISQMKELPKEKALTHVESICSSLELETKLYDKIYSLSLGYKKRVGIAQALIGNPKLVLMDEPISGLDVEQILEMRSIIQKIPSSTSVLIASHILSELEKICESFFFLHQGEIVFNTTKTELEKQISNSSFEIVLNYTKNSNLDVNKDFLSFCGEYDLIKFERIKNNIFLEIKPKDNNDFFSSFFKSLKTKNLELQSFRKKEMKLEDFFIDKLKSR